MVYQNVDKFFPKQNKLSVDIEVSDDIVLITLNFPK